MPRQSSDKLIRRHIIVYEDDWLWLTERFGDKGLNVGVSKIVREVLHRYVNGLKGRIDDQSNAVQLPDTGLAIRDEPEPIS